MDYIDQKYVKMCGNELLLFKKKTDSLYNFRCPICGDSKKNKLKARGYFQVRANKVYFKCHNCGVAKTFSTFIKEYFPHLYSAYVFEKYKNTHTFDVSTPSRRSRKINIHEPIVTTQPYFSDTLTKNYTTISELDATHSAKMYMMSRKIPDNALSRIYYVPDFSVLVKELNPAKAENMISGEPRIVFPLRKETGELFGVIGRSLDPNTTRRYISIKRAGEEDTFKCYGLERYNPNEMGYLVEGAIDSEFLPNCVALAGAGQLKMGETIFQPDKMTLVFDNEPRNREIVGIIGACLRNGFRVCIWPENFPYKDINDAILGGYSQEKLKELVDLRTFTAIIGQLEFSRWKRV